MSSYKIFGSAAFIFSIALLISSCEYQEFEPVQLSNDDTISFSEVILPMFESSCYGSGCHISNGGVPPNLEPELAHISLIGGNYVDTANAEESILYTRMKKDMPPSGKLSELEIEQVLLWIKQGALDN